MCYLWEKEFYVWKETEVEFQRVVGDDNPNRVGSWMARLKTFAWSKEAKCLTDFVMVTDKCVLQCSFVDIN